MEPKWRQMYNDKLTTPEEAVKLIENGAKFALPTINGAPKLLSKALANRIANDELSDVELIIGLNLNALDLIKPEVLTKMHYINGYLSPFERPEALKNNMDVMTWRYFDDARMMVERGLNVCFMTAAPMDDHGYFSCALNNSHTFSLFKRLKKAGKPVQLFLEVNKNAPTCYGYNQFHISDVTALVEGDWDLVEIPQEVPNDRDTAIASYIAEQIPDGACIQLGIGGLPNAVGKQLLNKKNLGCHSEMIVEAYLDLYEAGVMNNSKKNYMTDRFIGTMATGTKKLYEWIDHNPAIWINGLDEVCDPNIVALNDNFMSINSIIEFDLGGQIVADSMGVKPYSGMGGQPDFVEGAWRSKGGKSFLAMYSSYTDKEGKQHSKVVPKVSGWVGITRNDVQYLATEYGCVFLKGKTITEKAKLVISIAHPDFRESLVYEAKKMGLISSTSDINIKHMRKDI